MLASALSLFSLIASCPTGGGGPNAVSGVVVEEVERGWGGDKAGIQPGDVIRCWSRADRPDGTPTASGRIDSAFDLAAVEVDEIPRGPVRLAGRRGRTDAAWLSTLPFRLTVRPILPDALLALYRGGKDLVGAKDVPRGVERWRAAAVEARARRERLAAAWFLSGAARVLAAEQLWPEADRAYEEAVREAEGEPASPATALILRQWGNALLDRSDFQRAEECFRRALTLHEGLDPGGLGVALNLHSLSIVAKERGDFDAAEEHGRHALAIRERLAPGSLDFAHSLNNLGAVIWGRGDLAAADEYFARALAIREKQIPVSLDMAVSLNNLGVFARKRGDLVMAEELYRSALAIREKLAPGGVEVAGSLINLGVVAAIRGDFAAAEEYHRRALAILDKERPEGVHVPLSLMNLGAVAAGRGDFSRAEEHYRRALALWKKRDIMSPTVAACLHNLGNVLWGRGDLAAAEEHYRRVLERGEKLAPGSLEVALTLYNIGEIAAARGDLATAEEHSRRALAIRERLAPGSILEAESLHHLALVHRRTGRVESASALLLRALDALESQRSRLGGTEEVRSAFAAQYSDYYHDSLETLIQLGREGEALHVLERSRARSLLTLLAERDLLFGADLPAELARERGLAAAEYERVQAGLAQLKPATDGERIEGLRVRLREIRERQEEIAVRVRKASPRLASLQYPQPLDLAGARDALDPGTLFLAYSVGSDSTVLFVVRPASAAEEVSDWTSVPGLAVFSLSIGRKALREKVEAFRRDLRPGNVPRTSVIKQAAALYDLLIRPAEPQIAGSQRLLVSPDGPLHSLPFAALVRNKSGSRPSYLVEWKALHIAPSATVYAEIQKSRRDAVSPGRLVAFGDPRYPPLPKGQVNALGDARVRSLLRDGVRLPPLPFTRREVRGIAGLFPDRADIYLGEQATEERAKALDRDARYIHFACHASLDERSPLDSSLALSIPERPAEGQDNGLLQAWEIFERVRIDADLVTLSGCKTGLGKDMGGEGLLGLTRAFHYAGARSVLASLWAISDASTPSLMTGFYTYLKAGKSRDEALRAAQIDLIRRRVQGPKGKDLSQPFRWAAFQLSGDWH